MMNDRLGQNPDLYVVALAQFAVLVDTDSVGAITICYFF